MTTRRRAGRLRAAALTALAGASLAVPATPAAAAPPAVRILSVSADDVRSGETVRVRFRATNNERRNQRVFVTVSGGLRCTDGCSASADLGPGRSETFEAALVAPPVRGGGVSGRNIAVSARAGRETGFDSRVINVRGAATQPPGVSRVDGRVRDADDKALDGVRVTVRDGAGHEYRTGTDRRGRFSVTASDDRPITGGPITVVAEKDGFRTARATVQGVAGRSATVRLIMAAAAAPTTTPQSPVAISSYPAVTEDPPTVDESALVALPATAPAAGDDDGNSLLLATVVGGLLVAAGLGALALLVIRRRRNPAGPAPMAPTAPMAPGGMVEQPTAVLRPVAPGRDPRRGFHPGP